MAQCYAKIGARIARRRPKTFESLGRRGSVIKLRGAPSPQLRTAGLRKHKMSQWDGVFFSDDTKICLVVKCTRWRIVENTRLSCLIPTQLVSPYGVARHQKVSMEFVG